MMELASRCATHNREDPLHLPSDTQIGVPAELLGRAILLIRGSDPSIFKEHWTSNNSTRCNSTRCRLLQHLLAGYVVPLEASLPWQFLWYASLTYLYANTSLKILSFPGLPLHICVLGIWPVFSL